MSEATPTSTLPASLTELTASQAAQAIRARQVSPVELVQALLDRAAAVEPRVHAWETLDAEGALAAARAAEQQLTGGNAAQTGPLFGVPFGAKDIYDTAGLRTSASFGPYSERVPTEDAAAVAGLKQAGAILLGKTVTTQFAHMDPPRTRNPWSDQHTPGGSSSGSGAGVAAREMPLALGSQTAGSVLRPAAYNGVVGFKPTYGRISKRGAFPLAWSLDHVGMLARSVDDCALALSVLAGHDPLDPASADRPVPDGLFEQPDAPPTFGIWPGSVLRATPTAKQHFDATVAKLQAAGATVQEVHLGERFDLILAVQAVIMRVEMAGVHWQLLEQFPGAHSPRLRATVEVGRLIPGATYIHAQRLRRRLTAAYERMAAKVDALILPTAVDAAPSLETTGDSSLQAPFSLFGVPAISLPSGRSAAGLPYGLQLASGAWQEARLLRTARWVERALGPLPAPGM